MDGIPTSVYWTLRDLFTLRTLSIFHFPGCLEYGLNWWLLGGCSSFAELCACFLLSPVLLACLCSRTKYQKYKEIFQLQSCAHLCFKIHALNGSLLLLPCSHGIWSCPPPGCIKGRFIFDHLWDAFGSWHSMLEGLLFLTDFSKAYNSATHTYCSIFFSLMGLPMEHVTLLLLLSKALMTILLHCEIHLNKFIHPQSGVRQGCPWSPTLFAMLISPLVHKLQGISDSIAVFPCMSMLS